ERLPERDHAHFEDAILNLREVALERAMQAVKLRSELARAAPLANAVDEPADSSADDRELAHDVHQVIELANVDAHRLRDGAKRQIATRFFALRPQGAGDPRCRQARRRPRTLGTRAR